jgi:flagella basal body P-ring formation protein FlgA
MRRPLKLLALLILVGIPAGLPLRGQVIVLPDRVEVRNEQISLGDLSADVPVEYAEVSFGYAPYPGHHRWLTRTEVMSTLKRAGIADLKVRMPEQVLLNRASSLLDPRIVREAVASYLASFHPGITIELVDLEMPQDVALPEGDVVVSVASSNIPTRFDGITLKLDITVDGLHQRSQWVRVRARATGPVAVLLRDVGFGEGLKASDLVVETREVKELDGCIGNPEVVIGAVLKRSMAKGEILRDRDVQEPVLVKRGETVTLLARTAALSISTSARARDSGSRGDVVTVENLSSRQLIQARVVGLGTVQVDVPGVRR